jgi:hypothetical protein
MPPVTIPRLEPRHVGTALALISLLSLAAAPTSAQSPSDHDAIVATARDYIDGFFAGDTARVRRSLHPDVAKRLVSGGEGAPGNQTAEMLVQMTTRVRPSASVEPIAADSITILHREADMALVRIGAVSWVDHLHLARFGDRWQIVNVLWQLRPRG